MFATLAATALLSLTFAGVAGASTDIAPGYDLFKTEAGSTFFFATVPNPQFVDFEGVPFGSFDFGGGPVPTDDTDTIVERIQLADLSGGPATIDIEIVALSLQSVDPVDFGFGAGFETIFITLNTSSPSTQSQMTIQSGGEGSPHGTFDSSLNLRFDVTGSVGGFYATVEKTIDATNETWQHAPTTLLQIPLVNHNLNGSDTSNDFWATGLVSHDDGAGTAIHNVVSAGPPIKVPALTSLGALLVGGLMTLGIAYRRSLRS